MLDKVFQSLYGKPSWNVKKGYGSFLTFEFGQPHLEIREPLKNVKTNNPKVKRLLSRRDAFVHGEWHLWIYCCSWRALVYGAPVGYSSSSAQRIQQTANELNGQALLGVTIDQHTTKTAFDFDFGGRLETKPYDKDSEQWLLYEPSGYVFVWRADGKYHHSRGNQPGDALSWHDARQPSRLKVASR